jgi:HlyD family secretion protein
MRVMSVDQVGALRRQVPPLGWPQVAALLAALLVSGALGYVTYVRLTTVTPAPVQTVAVTRGALIAGVNGTGTVVADNSSKVGFKGSGRVADVFVKVGDDVTAGQPLAQLDTGDLQAQVQQAQSALTTAEAKLQTVLNGARPEDVAAARAQLAQAQAKLADMSTARPEDVAAARAALDQARAKLDGLLVGRPEDVAAAQAQVDAAVAKLRGMEAQGRAEDVGAAQAALDQARAKLNAVYNPSPADVANARSAVDSAQATLASNEAKLQQVQEGATDADLQAGVAALVRAMSDQVTAQNKLDTLLQPTSADLIAAQVAVDNALSAYQSADAKLSQLQRPTDSDLAAAQSAVVQAQASLRSAQSKLNDTRPSPGSYDITAASEDFIAAARNLQIAQSRINQLTGLAPSTGTSGTSSGSSTSGSSASSSSQSSSRGSSTGSTSGSGGTNTASGPSTQDLLAAESAVRSANATLQRAQSTLQNLQVGGGTNDIATAQSNVLASQAQLSSAQAKLGQLLTPSPSDLAAAQSAYDQAVNNYQSAQAKLDALRNPRPDDVTAAQAAIEAARIGVTSAQAKLDDLRAQPKPADLAAAQSAVDGARATLGGAQAKLAQLLSPTADDVAVAEAAVRQAEQQLQLKATPNTEYDLQQQRQLVAQAQAQLETKRRPASDADVEAQRQAVAQAQAQLALKQQPSSANALEAQRQAVVQAQADAQLKTTPYTDQDVAQAVAGVEQARGQVALAKFNLDNAVLVAPFDGTISQVGLNPGELASGASTVGGGLITVVNPARLRVEAQVDESDVTRVEVGQPVQFTLDAVPGRPFRGEVTAVAPQSTTQSGVTSYLVSASVNGGQGIRPGMTATANIIYDRKNDVLIVPNRVLRRQGRDQVVDVLTAEGKLETRVVQRGLSNDQNTEITSGLSEGDEVVLPTTQTRSPNVPGGFGGGPGLGGPGAGPIRR